ncbi:MAG: prepilin-type N-terminal cleavage/methylation domain-containing protein [Desulfobacterales bacterium]|jgi:prepilin-type N-terminal cleavage/methylation domain-containing protein
MRKRFDRLNQKGFTLIELISVLIIMGVVTSVSIQRIDLVSDSANQRVLHAAIKELNIRESLIWSNTKISLDGYTNDEAIFAAVDTTLGLGFEWNPDPPDRVTGGTLTFKTASKNLNRQESTLAAAGKWE